MPKTQDKFLFFISLSLILVGALFVVSSSWHEAMKLGYWPWAFSFKHLIGIFIGIPLMHMLSFLHFRWYQKLAWPLTFISIILLLITAKWGLISGGSRRWLDLGFVQFQVSEFTKITTIILLAKVFFEKKNRLLALLAVSFSIFLVLKQPDLGTSILLCSGLIATLYASGLNFLVFLGGLGMIAYLLKIQILNTSYQLNRIKFWLEPYSDPLGQGYNLIQSEHAIGAGGLWGKGFGASVQKLGSLPISHADFIFSIIAEEIGFLGILALFLLFLGWIFFALKNSHNAKDRFGQILGFGLTSIISLQIIINICVATGLFPITGMTLPFISFGGSSLIATCIMTGIILNISRNLDHESLKNI